MATIIETKPGRYVIPSVDRRPRSSAAMWRVARSANIDVATLVTADGRSMLVEITWAGWGEPRIA